MLWIPISLFAAVFQTIRTAIQKNLKNRLSTHAITFTRYGFGLPFALLYFIIVTAYSETTIPIITTKFILFCCISAIVQIWGTSALIAAFSYKNFAVSSTYAKTEALIAAIFGVILFKEYLSWSAFIIICIGISGVILMSLGKENKTLHIKDLLEKGPLLGITSGFFFALTSLCVRQASLHLESGPIFLKAAFTLRVTVSIQVVIMLIYLLIKERDQFGKMATHWQGATWVGLTAILGSIGWFTAMALQNVALVKTVGQIELLLSIWVAKQFFNEHITKKEAIGILIIGLSIVALVWVI